MWENVGPRCLYLLLGSGLGVLGSLLVMPEPVPEVRVEVVKQVKTITEVKTNTVIKWKERTVTAPDGTITSEREGQENITVTGSTESSAEEHTLEDVGSVVDKLPRYQLGVEMNPLKYADLTDYRVSIYARIGNTPLLIGVSGQADLSFGVGVRYEF